MATDPQIIKKLSEDLDNLEEVIDDISKQIQNNLNKQLAVTSTEINGIIGSLEKGEDVTKKTSAALRKAQTENRRLGLDQNKLQYKLLDINQQLNKKYDAKLKAQKDSLTLQLQDNLLQQQLNESLLDYLRTLSNVAETEKKNNEERKKQRTLLGYLDHEFKNIYESASKLFSIAGLFKAIIDSGLRFNKVSVDLGKNLGYGVDNANRYTKELVAAAQTSDNLNFTLQNAADATNELNAATGFVSEYSKDALETQIMLTKQFKLTGEEAAGIYKLSLLTGKSSEKVNDEMVGAFVAARNQLGKAVPFRATMAEAAKVSGILASNLQNSPPAIVKAVVATKALGTSLEQTSKQGEALLNFETSIENELKAELLTGKQLNLERARAAALAGDQVTAAQELFSQVGSLAEFDRMNVLQKKAIAEAVGLTADELADQLRKQKIAQEQGKSLAQITKEEADEAQKRQDIQDKFNQAILKLQDLVGNLVTGPMSAFIESLSKGLDIIGKMFGFVGKIGEGFKKILGENASSALGGAASLATVGALVYVIGKSLLKGTYINPMITKDFSVAGGGGGGGGFFGGGGGSKKGGPVFDSKANRYRDPKTGRFTKAPKGGIGKGMVTKGGIAGILASLGLGYAASEASEAGNEDLAKGLNVSAGILGGAASGAMLGSAFPVIGTAIGAIAGGLLGGGAALLSDDMVGYGARTLITPKGPIALNNQDTVIAGTNLFKGDDVTSFPKGALNLSGDVDLTPMITALNEVKTAITGISNRPIKLYVDGTEIITKMEKSATRTS
jgi:hypothetical protein